MTNTNRVPAPGYATADGTEHYFDRFPELDPDHIRLAQGMTMSSIGIGTYLGTPTSDQDTRYIEAVKLALGLGCNVVDTSINYRLQRSERAVAEALHHWFSNGLQRNEIVICTKGGFLPFDSEYKGTPRDWLQETLIAPGIITSDDIVGGVHCMSPPYLRHQISQSLQNLGLETIDIYYLHNPETQLSELPEEEFYHALELAFAALEAEVAAKRICCYGTATWDGYLAQKESGDLMSLERVVECARRAGGDSHHFKFVQIPLNLAMSEALTNVNQTVNGMAMTPLEAANSLNVAVVASASLLQAQLTRNLPPTVQMAISDVSTDAARALQFTRSAPGVTTALVGMSDLRHVRENMDLATLPPMPEADFGILFGNR